VNETLTHEGESVREFYSKLPGPVRVGIEATGSMKWFLLLMEELGIDCQVGHPATIRAAEPRRQKHDRRDAELLLKLLVENRFPSIWQPSKELLDLRALLLHRHQWVRLRTGYRTRCRRLPWRTVYGEGVRCGAKADKSDRVVTAGNPYRSSSQ
jgi:transposase